MDAVIKDAWPRLATTTLTDQVYTVLRDRILAGQVCPGEFIREQEVSDAAGVSRTPVREALGRLASEGFLERIAHRGFRVPEESINDLLELYPILGTLEALAGRGSFPRLDEADIVELHEINRDYAAAADGENHRAGIDLNDRFHHMLSRRAENGHLESMLDDLRAMSADSRCGRSAAIVTTGPNRSPTTMRSSRPSRRVISTPLSRPFGAIAS